MEDRTTNRPSEIFGYPANNVSREARDDRANHLCPFKQQTCTKNSSLVDFPFGVCTVYHGGGIRTVCPERFQERGSLSNVPKPLEEIARHYFGDLTNVVLFPEVTLPRVGRIDFVLVRHKTMKPEVDEFTAVEFQADSTTSTGHLVNGLRDFQKGQDLTDKNYPFGMNTYDTIKRAITQLMNKGIVYELWNTKAYWVMQEYIYANLIRRYGFKEDGFLETDSSYFALYEIVTKEDRLTLQATRYISTSVDEVYRAMRNKPSMPSKDSFVQGLNDRLRLTLNVGVD